MIKLKELLFESLEGITPSTIYNFYFLWSIRLNEPNLLQNEYGKYVMDDFLKRTKIRYISLFKELIFNQIRKYVMQQRIDPDFDKSQLTPDAPAETLWKLMQKTFRSDMKRRNDVWNLVGEYLTKLENSSSSEDIFLYINQLNQCVHNTKTAVLGKATNGYELMRAYDTVHKYDPTYWKQNVNKDLRHLVSQENS